MEQGVEGPFGRRCEELRARAGLSREALARLAGVDAARYAAVEEGRADATLGEMGALARALGVALPELVRGI